MQPKFSEDYQMPISSAELAIGFLGWPHFAICKINDDVGRDTCSQNP